MICCECEGNCWFVPSNGTRIRIAGTFKSDVLGRVFERSKFFMRNFRSKTCGRLPERTWSCLMHQVQIELNKRPAKILVSLTATNCRQPVNWFINVNTNQFHPLSTLSMLRFKCPSSLHRKCVWSMIICFIPRAINSFCLFSSECEEWIWTVLCQEIEYLNVQTICVTVAIATVANFELTLSSIKCLFSFAFCRLE